MLIWTARFSKKKAVCTVIIAGLVMALLIVLTGRMPDFEPAQQPELTTNEERVSYLDSLGWQVAPGACGNTAVPAACSAGRYVSGL